MPKKINLDIASVEQREQRLGTIIAWDGTTEELHKQSSYELRGQRERGAGCGGNCRLCELSGPFTQGSVCSEQMVECQAGNVRDAVLIQHAPIGCGGGQTVYNNIYRNGLVMRGYKAENLRIINTNLIESDMVFGAADKLRQSIDDAFERYQPQAIFVASSCATGIIGEDIESITDEKEAELGIPVVPLACEGFRSKHWSTGLMPRSTAFCGRLCAGTPRKNRRIWSMSSIFGARMSFRPCWRI